MKRSNISNNVIRRLPMYLRKLDDLAYHDIERISSGELGRQMGLTPSQIRQDFSCFGEFGQQGYGYNVNLLREQVATILGATRGYTVILAGVGNLGHALIENFGFERHGFHILAGFDVNPDFVGTEVAGVPIYSSNDIPDFLRNHHVDIGVLSTSRRMARPVASLLAENGIRAIWNFTNIELELRDPNIIVENVHFSDSLLVLSYYLDKKEPQPENV